MKKYITICLIVVLLLGLVYYLNFYTSFHLNFNHKVSTDITTNGKDIIFNNKNQYHYKSRENCFCINKMFHSV